MKEAILVSSCLLGNNCKYSGGNNLREDVLKLREKYYVIPVCPETLGKLPIPRIPSEISGDKVIASDGTDRTKEFELGASRALMICKKYNCKKAVLKEKSPSCGVHNIYDGTFSGTLIKGQGEFTRLLILSGVEVYNETEVKKLL